MRCPSSKTQSSGKTASRKLDDGYGAYLYVVSGQVQLDGQTLSEGDAAKISGVPSVDVEADEDSELAMVVVRV